MPDPRDLSPATFARLVMLLTGPREVCATGSVGQVYRALAERELIVLRPASTRTSTVRLTTLGRRSTESELRRLCGATRRAPLPSLASTHSAPLEPDEYDLRETSARRRVDGDRPRAAIPSGWAGQGVNPYGELGEP